MVVPDAISKFRRCQEKVNELKSIHNMLHEIEAQLYGLSATIQLRLRGERGDPFDFRGIRSIWQLAALKIDDLAYFAAEEMEMLEDERLSFGNTIKGAPWIIDLNTIKGAPWIIDLFSRKRDFEVAMRDQDIDRVRDLLNELLTNCRSHLYHIDKRLLKAVKELDLSSHLIIKGKI